MPDSKKKCKKCSNEFDGDGDICPACDREPPMLYHKMPEPLNWSIEDVRRREWISQGGDSGKYPGGGAVP